ncbi:neurotrimin-like [Scylla paramamosain]|uniref:neurotrimin-like n=1 Tax=Scylla paramamosain TaxID=85552 RepID=UPI00308347CF
MASFWLFTPLLLVLLLLLLLLLPLLAFVSADEGSSGRISQSPAPPDFAHPAHNLTAVEGQEVTLACSVTNLHGYQLAWVHEDTQTILSVGDQLYTQSPRLSLSTDQHGAELTLSPVLAEDRGWYMCQLNTGPMTYTRSYLQVLVAPALEEWSGAYVEAREGSKVFLICRARAYPPARTTWRRADADPIFRSPRIVWEVDGEELEFPSVRREQGGAYTCRVDNKVTAPVSRTTHVTVTYAPVLWLGREMVGVREGASVTLNCSSEANPPPRHYWTVNRSNITTGEKYQVDETRTATRTQVQLTIRQVGREDFASYACHAFNPTGHARGTIKLYEIREHIVTHPTTAPLPSMLPTRRTHTDIFRRLPERPNTTLQDPRERKHSRLKTNRIPGDWGGTSGGQHYPGIIIPTATITTTHRKEGSFPGRINFHQRSGVNGSSSAGNSFCGGMRGIGCFSWPLPSALCHTLLAFALPMVLIEW